MGRRCIGNVSGAGGGGCKRREGTEQEQVLALPRRREGAMVAQITAATGSHRTRSVASSPGWRPGFEVQVLERVRQAGPGRGGAAPRYAVGLYQVSTAEQGHSGLGLEAQHACVQDFMVSGAGGPASDISGSPCFERNASIAFERGRTTRKCPNSARSDSRFAVRRPCRRAAGASQIQSSRHCLSSPGLPPSRTHSSP